MEVVLDWLEAKPKASGMVMDAAFNVLYSRLHRELPPRPWLDRVLKVCALYPTISGAQGLYQTITGRPLTP